LNNIRSLHEISGKAQGCGMLEKMADHDEKSLPLSVGKLFELNRYAVEYGVNINGAEIDIIAKPIGDPFGATVYIETTVQYVDNTKYGKDATKFILVKSIDPSAKCLSVSTKGFTAEVKERSIKSGIITQSYQELFRQFEKFHPYVEKILANTAVVNLIDSYEEPFFKDVFGKHTATEWLNNWLLDKNGLSKWLIVLGEYGTGKTSLTNVIQYRWLQRYHLNPDSPIPIRIELRNFSR
jgi:hypothetical protein